MWHQDREKVPASELTHLSNDNLRFALALRKEEHLKGEKQKKPKRPTTSHNSRTTTSQFDELTKSVECRNSACLRREEEIILALLERKESTHRINQLKADIIEEDYFLESSTKEYDQIMEKQQRITRMLAGLENDYSKVAAKAKALKEERVAIENQIYAINRNIEAVKTKEKDSARKSVVHHSKHSWKHNGVYTTTFAGHPQWSCCLADREDAAGCIEEHSVGLLGTMAQIRSPLRNYVKVVPDQNPIATSIPFYGFGSTMKSAERSKVVNESSFIEEKVSMKGKVHEMSFRLGRRNSAWTASSSTYQPANGLDTSLNQQSSVWTSFRESVGKVRENKGETTFKRTNRPMSSPAGYQLYRR